MKNGSVLKSLCVLVAVLSLQGFLSLPAANAAGKDSKKAYENTVRLFHEESYEEALRAAEDYFERNVKEYGSESVETLKWLSLRGILKAHLGQDALAEDDLKEALNRLERTGQTKTRFYGVTLENLGSLYLLQNYPDEAEDYYKRALKVFRNTLKPGNVRNAVALNSLGLLYLERKRYGEAEEKLLESRRIFEASTQQLPRERAVMLHNLGELYFQTERYEQAEKAVRKALKLQTRKQGKGLRLRIASLTLAARIAGALQDSERRQQTTAEAVALEEQLKPRTSAYVTDRLIWKMS